jgi:hypothetical protein
MEMECELLISNFKNPKTIDLVGENIGRISDGSSSHAANALKLGLKKAFELKTVRKSVKLQCSNYLCGWHNNPSTYANMRAGSNVYCYSCRDCGWGSYYFQCTGCANNRTSNGYTSCQSCGSTFV